MLDSRTAIDLLCLSIRYAHIHSPEDYRLSCNEWGLRPEGPCFTSRCERTDLWRLFLVKIYQAVTKMLYPAGAIAGIRLAVTALALAAWCVSPGLVPNVGVAYAQNTNATIRGQVLDPSGAVVPNAQVQIVNQDTGVVVFNGVSDSAGAFVAPQVIPGTYRVTVTATGL
jgi:hypothetical protein